MTATFTANRTVRRRTRGLLLGRTALCGVLSLGLAATMAARPAKAGPEGGAVVQGGATIQTTGTHTQIDQTTQQALITWQDFSIGSAESVNFAQPGKEAVALNKVLSNIPSDIQGQLTANGQVWIINPNGVFVGKGAQVNVGGLIATSSDLVQHDWEAGSYTFEGAPAGSAVNVEGAVTATDGSIVLVAPLVDVSGSLSAQGDVALGAGGGFAVDFHGDGLTRFAVDAASGARLNMSGVIAAQGGAAYLVGAATDAVEDAVVSVGGQVEATRIEERGGVIVISGGAKGVTEVSGTVDASQVEGEGGNVTVTGGLVHLTGTAVVDASGASGGGTVEIGGGFQGAAIASDVVAVGPAPDSSPLPTARRTVVSEGAQIAANAGQSGDGGTVIVWADEATGFYGSLSATGGVTGGDGGFAEVSGKLSLGFDGDVDLTAAYGAAGTLLLDPANIVIANNDAGGADNQLNDNEILFGDSPGSTLTISDEVIEGRNNPFLLQATNNITINQAIDDGDQGGNNTNALTMEAGNDIVVDANVTLESALTLRAGNDVSIANNDDIVVAGNLTITADASLNGVASDGNGTITWGNDNSGVDAGGDAVFDVADPIALGALTVGGNFSLTAAGAVTNTNTISITGTTLITATGFNVTLNDGGNNFGGVVSVAGNNVHLVDTNSIILGDIDAAGSLEVDAGGAITDDSENVAALDAGINVGTTTSLDAGTDSDIILDSEFHDFVGTVTINDPGGGGGDDINNVTIFDTNALTVAQVTVDNDVVLRSGGLLTSAGIDTNGAVTLTGTNLDLTGNIDNATSATIRNTSGGIDFGDTTVSAFHFTDTEGDRVNVPLTLDAAGTITLNDVTFDQNLTLIATGDVNHGLTESDLTGTVSASAVNITLADDGSLVLGDINASGALIIHADDGISQMAPDAITVSGIAGLTTDGMVNDDITLDSAQNDFGGAVDLTGYNVSLRDSDALSLSTVNATNDLTLRAGGSITDTDGMVISVGGTTSITAANDADTVFFDVALDVADMHVFFGEVDIVGGDITIDNVGALQLGTVTANANTDPTIGTNLGDLIVRAGGTVTDTGDQPITTAGTTSIEAVDLLGTTFYDIVLDGDAHDFGATGGGDVVVDAVHLSGGDILVEDDNDITLGVIETHANVDATLGSGAGDLTIISDTGSIEDDPAADAPGEGLSITGASSFTAPGGESINLDAPGATFQGVHDFGTGITINVTGGGNLVDLGLVDVNALNLTPQNITTTNSITLGASSNILTDFAGFTLTTNTFTMQSTSGNIALLNDNAVARPDLVGFLNIRSADLAAVVAPNIGLLASGQFIVDAAGFAGGNLEVGGGTGVTFRDGDGIQAQIVGSLDFGGNLTVGSGTFVTFNEPVSVTGDLSVDAGTNITVGNTVTVGGAATLSASGGFLDVPGSLSVTNDLDADANSFVQLTGATSVGGSLTADSATSYVYLDNSNSVTGDMDVTATTFALIYGSTSVGGSLTANAGDEVEIVGPATVGGNLTANSATSYVGLAGAKTITGDLDINAATTAFLFDAITIGDELLVNAGTSIVDLGAGITVNGNTDLTAPTITLDGAGNAFGNAAEDTVSVNGTTITLNDSGPLRLGTVNATGNMTVTAGGIIDDNGTAITVAGTLSANTEGSAITLDEAGNAIGTFAADTDLLNDGGEANVTVRDGGALALGAIDANNLTVTTGGTLTDTPGAAIAVAGTTSISAGTFDVQLDNLALHDFNEVDLTAGDVVINDLNDIQLGAITTSANADPTIASNDGSLTVNAGTFVNFAEPATIAGDLSVDAVTSITAIQNLSVGGDLTADAGTSVQIGGTNSITGDLDIDAGTFVFFCCSGVTTVGGNLSATATANDILDFGAGAVSIAGNSTLTAGGNITLTSANTFGDAATDVVNVSGTNITFSDTGPLRLGTVNATGNMTVTAGGIIDENGTAITVAGTLSANTEGFAITLDEAGNAIGTFAADTDLLNDGGEANVTVRDGGALALGAIDANNLTVTTGGTLTDTAAAAIAVAGTTSISAGTFDVQLDNANLHDFNEINIIAGDIFIDDLDDIQLGAITAQANADPTIAANNGSLTVLADGNIDDVAGKTITVPGAAAFNAGTFDVILDDGPHAFSSALSVSGSDFQITSNGNLVLGAVNLTDNLTVTARGSVTDTALSAISVGGTASITAENAPGTTFFDVALDNTDLHNFNRVDIRAGDIFLDDVNAIALGSISANANTDPTIASNDGSLTVLAGGSVTDTDTQAIAVAGLTSIVASNAAGTVFFDVNLDNADLHDLNEVDVSAGDVTLDDVDDVQLGTIVARANADATIASNVGDLLVRAGGAVTDAGVKTMSVNGLVTIEAQNPAGDTFFDVTLNNAGQNFGTVNVTGDNITLNDATGIVLAAISAENDLTVTTGGSVIDTGAAISVGGLTSISAGTFDVALDTADTHDFNEVDIAAGDITIDDVNGITLGAIAARTNADPTISTNGGDLVVRAGGAIDDSDVKTIDVQGRTTLQAQDAAGTTFFDVTLDNTDHDFDSNAAGAGSQAGDAFDTVNVTGANVTLRDTDAIALGTINANGDFDLAAGGTITDTASAPITVTGATTIVAQSGANYFDVVLDNAVNGIVPVEGLTAVTTTGSDPGTPIHDFGSSINVEGEDIRIRNLGDITVTAIGHDDTAVASSDPTIGSAYDVSINTGVSVQTASISPNGSVAIQSDGLLAIDQVVADQDVLLATDTNFSVMAAGVPVRSNGGDIWMPALQGSFLIGAERQLPAGTLFSAPEGNIAIFVKDAFRVVLDGSNGVNTALIDPPAPEGPVDQEPGIAGYQALPVGYENNGLVLETAPTGIALISVGAGDVAIGTQTFLDLLDAHIAENEANGTNDPFVALSAQGELTLQDLQGDVFVATGHLALESWNGPPAPGTPNSVGFFVENTSSTVAGGTGSRVMGATYVGGFWNGIGIFGTFNGVTGQSAALQSFVTEDGGSPTGGRLFVPGVNPSQSALDIANAIGDFAFNPFNLANGCPIGAAGFAGCSPTMRIILLLEVEDGSLLAFRFQDDEEEEDDDFSNRGDEEEWQ